MTDDDEPDSFEDHQAGTFDSLAMQQMLVAADTVESFLDEFTQRAGAELGRHCSITLETVNRREPYTVASSDDLTIKLDEFQYANDDGPCLQALRTGTPVFVVDFLVEPRFGNYPTYATNAGARSSMSYPLTAVGGSVRGALNLYSAVPADPNEVERDRAERLAENAGEIIALAQRLGTQDDLVNRLRLTLESRSTIDQAIGVLMAQQLCTPEDAFRLLVRASQNRNIKLREVAASIVTNMQHGS